MYLKNDGASGYDRHGQQVRQRGLFLLFVQPKNDASSPIKCVVRKVAMKQFGHWMMGKARIHGHSVTVSGAYGGDGLPCNVPQEVYDKLTVVLPPDLYEAWNKGEGWNSAGKEAPSVRQWALANLDALSS